MAIMQWFILSRDMHVLCTPSTDIRDSLPIDDSGSNGQQISIVNNVAVGEYNFITDAKHPDVIYIEEGNYICFEDKYGKHRLYTIMTIDGDDTLNVHCEDIGLDLINEESVTWDTTGKPEKIEATLNRFLYDTGWTVGLNEIPTKTVGTKFDSLTDTHLTRLGDVMGAFGAECDFEIVMNGMKVDKQVINIYETLGEDRTQQRFIDNINLISLSRSGSIEDLCTCMRCYGNENSETGARLSIENIVYDDGRYYSPKGHIRIYDREAHTKWSRFRSYGYQNQGEFEGYINGTFEYDTDDAQELFNKGLEELQSRNDKKVTYEVELYDLEADIGDTVQISDNSQQEKIYLSARVQTVQNHYSVSGEDTGVLANYKILTSDQASEMKTLVEEIKKQVISIKSTDIAYAEGESATEAPTTGWQSQPVDVAPGNYLWTKTVTVYSDGSQSVSYSVSRNSVDGINGEDGNGIAFISHYYLASSESSGITIDTTGWVTTPPVINSSKRYLWYYETVTYTSGATSSTIPCIIGAYGDKGDDGKGVHTSTVTYQASESGTTPPTGEWTTTIPVVDPGDYLWTRTVITYTDNTTSILYSVGKIGSIGVDGKGISSIKNYYLASSASSGVTIESDGWTETVQTITSQQRYLWNYEEISYTDDTTTLTTPCIIGVYGDSGIGISNIKEYYAVSTSNDVPPDEWSETVPVMDSTNRYLWNYEKITYTNGYEEATEKRVIGVYGDKGEPGVSGVGILSISEYYAVSSSNVVAPTSWSEEVPTMDSANRYLWNYEILTYTDQSIFESRKRVIGVYGESGLDGKGIDSITNYYLVSSASSGITTESSGWDETPKTTSAAYPYLWNYEKILYTDGTSQNTQPAVIGTHGATGSAGSDGQMLYATCTTAAGTAVKTANLVVGSLTLKTGATVAVRFTNANTADSPTLNIGSTGVKPIFLNSGVVSSSNPFKWVAGTTVLFVYNGSQWVVTATSCAVKGLIAAGAITTEMLAANSVTAEKININDLYALSATIGGWSISQNRIYKSYKIGTAGDATYKTVLDGSPEPKYTFKVVSTSSAFDDPNYENFQFGITPLGIPYKNFESSNGEVINRYELSQELNNYASKSSLNNLSNTVNTLNTNFNNHKKNVSRVYGGTVIKTFPSTGTAIAVLSSSEINSKLGVSNSGITNTVVFASNGDGGAQAAHIEGCTFQNNTWYAVMDRKGNGGPFRLNYMVVYWG